MNKALKSLFFTLIILVLFQTLYIIDLKSKLDNIMAELMNIKSEEHIFPDENNIMNENYIETETEKNNNKEHINKPISEEKIVKKDGDNISKNRDNIKMEKAEDIQLNFFSINPKIDIDALIKKYKKVKTVTTKPISTKEKKRVFIEAVLPAIKESYQKLIATYKSIKNMQETNLTIQDEEYLNVLYKIYRVKKGDIQKLLLAVKPHPISVMLAQATLESGWGTSRFYKEANNVFGIWSFSRDDDRIKAKYGKNVYLKKYDSYVEAVDDYMAMLGKNPRYKKFREVRSKTENPYEIIKHLEIYSELRAEYVNRLRIVIKANRLQRFDIKENKNIAE